MGRRNGSRRKPPARLTFAFIYKNPVDIGMAANFNACLRQAKGEYIKFLCADDVLLPESLQRMSHVLDSDPRVTLVVGGRRLIDESGRKFSTKSYSKRAIRISGTQAINRCLFGVKYIGEPSAVMFRRSVAQRGFRESLVQLIDLEMWFYLLEQGAMAVLADEICSVRRHSGQETQRNIRSGAPVDDNIFLFGEYGGKPYVKRTLVDMASWKLRIAYLLWLCKRRHRNKEERSNHKCAVIRMALFFCCAGACWCAVRMAQIEGRVRIDGPDQRMRALKVSARSKSLCQRRRDQSQIPRQRLPIDAGSDEADLTADQIAVSGFTKQVERRAIFGSHAVAQRRECRDVEIDPFPETGRQ